MRAITSWDYVDRYSPTGTGELPWGVSVWRDDDRIVAAAYVYDNGFEWCHRRPLIFEPPGDLAELAALPDREYFSLADDEKTMIVGPLDYARPSFARWSPQVSTEPTASPATRGPTESARSSVHGHPSTWSTAPDVSAVEFGTTIR